MRSIKTTDNEIFLNGVITPSHISSENQQIISTLSLDNNNSNIKRKLLPKPTVTPPPLTTTTTITTILDDGQITNTASITNFTNKNNNNCTSKISKSTKEVTSISSTSRINKRRYYQQRPSSSSSSSSSTFTNKNQMTSKEDFLLIVPNNKDKDSCNNDGLLSSSEWFDQTSLSPSNPSENSIEGSFDQNITSITNNNNNNSNNNLSSINGNCNIIDDDEDDSEQELPSLTWLTRLAVTMLTNNPPMLDVDDDTANLNGFNNNNSNNNNNNNNANGNNNNNNNNNSSSTNKSSSNQNSSTNNTQRKEDTLADRYNKFMEQVKLSHDKYYKEEEYYLNNGVDKPIFNYATIIAMAMLENGRMTLQEICSWIEQKFKYYRGKKKWNNSIRHNLSLQYCFRKINRDKFEKGKGGYWELGMDISKGERKRIRNKKPHVANNNNNNSNNHNYNSNNNNNNSSNSNHNTYINNQRSSSLSSPSSLSPLLCSSSEDQNHQQFLLEKRPKLSISNNNDDDNLTTTIITSTSSPLTTTTLNSSSFTGDGSSDNQNHVLSVNSLERIILDVLENGDDISSSYNHHHHNGSTFNEQEQQQSQLDDTMEHETVTNFLNQDTDDEDYTLVGNNLDVLEQTFQQHIEQNNVTTIFSTNDIGHDAHNIINTTGTIITTDNSENFITLNPSNQHSNEITTTDGTITSTIDIPTSSIVQISTADGCYSQIVEITNNDNFLNVNHLNRMSSSSRNTTAGTSATSTSDIFDEDLTAAGTMVDPTTMEAQSHHHIYSSPQNEIEVPESCEDIVASVLNNYPCNGPSVVVEPIPSYTNHNDNINNANDNMNNLKYNENNLIRIGTTTSSSTKIASTLSEEAAIDIFHKISSITAAITTTTATIASANTALTPTLLTTNFCDDPNDDDGIVDEEFNFFKYTDDVDRRGDVDLFPFDGISTHEF